MAIREKFGHILKVVYACSVLEGKKIENKKEINLNYVKLLEKVTKSIDKWQQRNIRYDFEDDEDFIGRTGSPTKFDTLSNLSDRREERDQGSYRLRSHSNSDSSVNILDNKNTFSERNDFMKPIKMVFPNKNDEEERNRINSDCTANQNSK